MEFTKWRIKSMVDMIWISFAILGVFLVIFGLFVLGDVLRYRDLQRRLNEERSRQEAE